MIAEDDQQWNDEHEKEFETLDVVFCLVHASDDLWYCWNNGYVVTDIFNKKFTEMNEIDQIRFVEDYCSEFDTRM